MSQPVRLLILIAALILTSGAVNATLIGEPGNLYWTGTCLDCTDPLGSASPANATLAVSDFGNAEDGTATDISGGNLVGFSYFSELFPFGLFADPEDIVMASGIIPMSPGARADVMISFVASFGVAAAEIGEPGPETLWRFISHESGIWELFADRMSYDMGVDSRFNGVPEPTTLLLVGFGLAGCRRVKMF